ncbi:Transcription termination/antitermination protein NusA [Chlamydiales bacterium SCGC AB-751-O23]|jgi:transcription termination/antitermination protein NusA|nr:Transcription termination/antitermination protein NusA [Chlamydiales bacterium SCGC AB-751-O23]
MNKDLIAIFEYLEREKGIKREIVTQAIEEALHAAAKKSIKDIPNVRISIDSKTAAIDVLSEKTIVKEVDDPAIEISVEEAKELDPDCEEGQFIDIVVTPKDFGRIAAQTARQVITQKLRAAEKDVIYDEYRHRVNEIISGTVKKFVRGSNIIIDLGKVEGILPSRNYPKIEYYRVGDKVQALLLEVRDTENGGAEVVLTRSHPAFVKHLFHLEVPELSDGTITIERIVREAGYRTKLTVTSSDDRVDPVGACVGMRGSRVKNVVRELNNEKIDIVPHTNDPVDLLERVLSPIEISKYSLGEDEEGNMIISIVVEDEDFPAVIGKRGLNARLNASLIGAELDIQKATDFKRRKEIQRLQLAESEDASLDEPLVDLEYTNKLIIENLIDAGFDTYRKLLNADIAELSSIPGMSIDLADQILDQITKEKV